MATPGCRFLDPGWEVEPEWEAADQDGHAHRATRVWPVGAEPYKSPADGDPDGAMASALTVVVDDDPAGPSTPSTERLPTAAHTGPVPIPEPPTGERRRDELAAYRRQRRGAVVAAGVYVVVLVVWGLVRGSWSVTAWSVERFVLQLAVFAVPAGGVAWTTRRIRAQSERTDVPGLADAAWSGAASFGPDTAYELGITSIQGGTGVLTVSPGCLRWVPDELATGAGHHAWELGPQRVREIDLTPSLRRAGIVRIVRVGRAIPLRLDVHPRDGLLAALGEAGFPVAD